MDPRSYTEQYQRMKRWYNRLRAIYEGIEHTVNSDYYQDEMYAFFQNCYHLKEWLKYDPKVIVSNNAIEDFANRGADCMRICGDLCNGSKHMVINSEKIDKDTGVKNRNYSLQIGGGNPIASVKYNIECQGEIYDALLLAECCIGEWDKFMNENDIPIPEDDSS